MSYILDALKRSDRSRQLNTTHELSYAHLNTDKRKDTFWLKVLIMVLSIVSLVSLSSIYFLNKKKDNISSYSSAETQELVVNTKVNIESELAHVTSDGVEILPENDAVLASDLIEETSEIENLASVQQETAVTIDSDRRSLFELTAGKDKSVEKVEKLAQESQAEIEKKPDVNSENIAMQSVESVVSTTDFSSYENYSSVRSQYGLPDMHLDILLHHSESAQRKAYINMSLYHEGDTTSDGAKVIEIGKEAVLLSYSSHDFILTAK